MTIERAINSTIEAEKSSICVPFSNNSAVDSKYADLFDRIIGQAYSDLLKSGSDIAFDFNEDAAGKRRTAVMTLLPDIRDRFSGKYPKAFIEEHFIRFNAERSYQSYDSIDAENNIVLGTALWLYSQLDIEHKFDEAAAYFPDEDESNSDHIPFSVSSLYDEAKLKALVSIIRHRNDDANSDYSERTIVNDASLSRASSWETPVYTNATNFDSLTPRERFDGIISLIDSWAIESACGEFDEKMMQVLEVYFDSIRLVVDRIENTKDRIFLTTASGEYDEEKMSSLIDQIAEDKLILKQIAFAAMGSLNSEDYMYLDSNLCPEALEAKECFDSIQINDPYEICFALLYLIDTGSDLVWLYSTVLGVMNAAAKDLPMDDEIFLD